MKILIVTDAPVKDISGVSTVVHHTCDYLVETGHDVKVFTPKFKKSQAVINEFSSEILHEFDGVSLAWFGHPELTFTLPIWGFLREMRRFAPDVVMVLDTQALGALAAILVRLSRLPLIAVCSTNAPQFAKYQTRLPFVPAFMRWLTRTLSNQAHLVLAPSQAMCNILTKSGFKPSQVWSLGVETDIYAPEKCDATLREQWFEDGHYHAVALYVGRLAKEKNIDALLPLAKNQAGVRLVIAGEGPDKKRLEGLFADTTTVFTGYLVGEPLAQVFASADVFVFPALAETFGHVVLQAMSSGVPVVAMHSPASEEHAQNSNNAVMLTDTIPEVLCETALDLINQPEKRQTMAQNGRAYALTMSWERVFEHLERYLAQTLEIANKSSAK